MLATETSFDFPLDPIFSERPKSIEPDAEPEMLCGELWREGEMAILFGDQGVGKSLLAVQIGEAIASGTPTTLSAETAATPPPAGGEPGNWPFEMLAGPRKVLFLDLQHTDRQFATRYSAGLDDEAVDSYVFSDNFDNRAVDVGAPLPEGFGNFCEYFCRATERLVVEKDVDVLIIDNLAYLKHSNDIVRDVLPLVRVLNRLKRARGLSILLVAQGQKRLASRGLTYHDMQGGKMLCNYVDSVFAIGQGDGGERYIKQLASKSAEIMYDKTLVPTFRIEKIGGNFLGFVFESFMAEKTFFEARGDEIDWPLIDRIKQMYDDDISLRDIAVEVGRSKTTVHRLLQMWKPLQEAAAAAGAAAAKVYDSTASPFYFPGKEEYDEADRDPRLHNLGEGPEFALLGRERYLIQWTRAKAHKEYKKTGRAPTLAEMKQRLPEWRELLAAQALADGNISAPSVLSVVEFPDTSITTEYTENTKQDGRSAFRAPPSAIPWAAGMGRIRITDLKRGLNDYGKEIFIESEDERGKPQVWYWLDSKRRFNRSERKASGGIVVKEVGRSPMLR